MRGQNMNNGQLNTQQGKWLSVALMFLLITLTGCSQSSSKKASSIDPLERYNRVIYRMNVGLDKRVLKPVARAYKKVTPEVVDNGITHIFLNLQDIRNAANSLLQLKPKHTLVNTERFIFNSTFGIAGIFDIATEMGLQKHEEDFGQTLAHWGVKPGPYLMLPLLGPSTLRDATGRLTLDRLADPLSYAESRTEVAAFVVKNLDKRADLLGADEVLDEVADDKYLAIRDAWLQRRESQIRDGKVDKKEDNDLINELESLDDE